MTSKGATGAENSQSIKYGVIYITFCQNLFSTFVEQMVGRTCCIYKFRAFVYKNDDKNLKTFILLWKLRKENWGNGRRVFHNRHCEQGEGRAVQGESHCLCHHLLHCCCHRRGSLWLWYWNFRFFHNSYYVSFLFSMFRFIHIPYSEWKIYNIG